MARDLSPATVTARLARLRAAVVPMSEGEARARMEDPAGREEGPFESAVVQRLEELRALVELTKHLQSGTRRERG
jgi:hypothetical protein